MSWFKVDDELHDHRKSRLAGKAAMGVWVLAGSWSMAQGTNGFVPASVLARWGNAADAKRLVAVGFWLVDERNGERGWRFHDWDHFQPPPEVIEAKKQAEREAGLRGNHKRWHVKRGLVDHNCPYCPPVAPDGEGDRVPDGRPDREPDRVSVARNPYPSPVTTEDADASSSAIAKATPDAARTRDQPGDRDDVERLCQQLADRIESNGSKRPTIGKGWRTACRLMLDTDGRTEDQVARAIDWCQADEFWRSNVLSMPKLREKYDQLRLAAQRKPASGVSRQAETDEHHQRALARADARAAARAAAQQQEPERPPDNPDNLDEPIDAELVDEEPPR